MEGQRSDNPRRIFPRLVSYQDNRADNRKRHPHVSRDETSVWEIYNDQAQIIDQGRIRDWNNSLNTLLIFAALYSAVLTAFIVESLKLIQEDPSDTTRQILLVISQQLANTTTPAFRPAAFVAPAWAVQVNYCFFASLSASLVTALGAVLALQWVDAYDRGLDQSSPEIQTLQRHFRRLGVNRWRMDQIIAALPAIIFLALFVFFTGLAIWLWHIQIGVAAIVMAGISVGALFYWTTTAVSMVWVSAPFRTPISTSLPSLLGRIKALVLLHFGKMARIEVAKVPSKMKEKIATVGPALRSVYDHRERLWPHELCKWFFGQLFRIDSFKARERNIVKSKGELKRDSLLWLARSINIGGLQRPTLLLITEKLMQSPSWKLSEEDGTNKEPWKAIFSFLYEPYLNDSPEGDAGNDIEEALFVLRSFSSIGPRIFSQREFTETLSSFYGKYPEVNKMAEILADWRLLESDSAPIEQRSAVVLRTYNHAIQHWKEWPKEFVIFILLNVKKTRLYPIAIPIRNLLTPIKEHFSVKAEDIKEAKEMPLDVFDATLETISIEPAIQLPSKSTSLQNYLASSEHSYQENRDNIIAEVHEAIVEQLCVRLSRLDPETAARNAARNLLEQLLPCVQSKIWIYYGYASFISDPSSILLAMAYTKADIWNEALRQPTAQILACILMGFWSFGAPNQFDWPDWWIEIVLGFGRFMARKLNSFELDYYATSTTLKRVIAANIPGLEELKPEQITRLQDIEDPCILLIVADIMHSTELAHSIIPQRHRFTESPRWTEWSSLAQGMPTPSHTNIPILRTVALIAASGLQDTLEYVWNQFYDINAIFETPKLAVEFYRSPVLYASIRTMNPNVIGRLGSSAHHEWFHPEFQRIDGFKWLALFLQYRPDRFDYIFQIVEGALRTLRTNDDWASWAMCLRDCLVAIGAAMNGYWWSKAPTYSPQGVMRALRERTREWVLVRSYPTFPPNNRAEIDTKPHTRDDWKELVDQIEGGLNRGYIAAVSKTRYHRYLKDPDDVCWNPLDGNTSSLHSTRPNNSERGTIEQFDEYFTRRYVLLGARVGHDSYPRDPDGICGYGYYTRKLREPSNIPHPAPNGYPRDPDGIYSRVIREDRSLGRISIEEYARYPTDPDSICCRA